MTSRSIISVGLLLVVASACDTSELQADSGTSAVPEATATTASTPAASAATTTSSAPLPPKPSSCPAEMSIVDGGYCARVEQKCLRHTKDYEEAQDRRRRARAQGLDVPPISTPERCLVYKRPSKCLSPKRRPMRFCMDTREWPNKHGELPSLLVSWTEARQRCEGIGKRLCTADEFNFACEGEDVLPYSYGYERDKQRCNIDKPYRARRRRLHPYERCMEITSCKEHLEEIDQRVPIGSTTTCTSPFGVHDLNGNVNEWVERPGERRPYRSGLKGGWWGPARSRCRPMVKVHDENYVGYEVGFRCCKDAAPSGG